MFRFFLFQWTDSAVQVPTVPGLEYTLPDGRLHYTLENGLLHYTMPIERLHYDIEDTE